MALFAAGGTSMGEMATFSRTAVFAVKVEAVTLLPNVDPLPISATHLVFFSLKPKQITKVALRVFANRPIVVEKFVDRSGAEIVSSIVETNQLDINLEAMDLRRLDLETCSSRL